MKPVLAALCLLLSTGAHAQTEGEASPLDALAWVEGPAEVDIASLATVDLQSGYTYLGASDTATLMEMMENPVNAEEYLVAPDDLHWYAVFSFEDVGYIEDDEQIDADSVLASIREANEYGNEERRRRGWEELQIIGWQYPPFYEEQSNRLSWAILAESGGHQVVNYNTRLLGRGGVMSATLVAGPEMLDSAVAEFNSMLDGFAYDEGHRYAEFRPGDKVAAYGLAALVAGGAAAAVAKSGAGKALFKFIGLGIVAVIGAAGALCKRIFGSKSA